MTEEFRLPKSSYDELVKIIRAYGKSGDEASLSEVAQAAAMHETIISRNNAFLASSGLIEGGKLKRTTPRGHALAMALQHDIAEEVGSHWRDVVLGNQFLQKMVSAVSIRQGMEANALQGHIAYSAGEPKTAGVMAGAGAVIEILKVAGFLTEQDGKLVAQESVVGQASEGYRPTQSEPVLKDAQALTTSLTERVGISIQIQIQCPASEIQDLGPKLSALLKELSKATETDGKNGD